MMIMMMMMMRQVFLDDSENMTLCSLSFLAINSMWKPCHIQYPVFTGSILYISVKFWSVFSYLSFDRTFSSKTY